MTTMTEFQGRIEDFFFLRIKLQMRKGRKFIGKKKNLREKVVILQG